MGGIEETGNGTVVDGGDVTLTYTPYAVRVSDGTEIAHESRGGTLNSVWSTTIGPFYVEVVHLGDGPQGGELVMTVTRPDDRSFSVVSVGALWAEDLPHAVSESWPVAVDLALGLIGPHTRLIDPAIRKDQLESFHQRLLGVLHG